MVERLINKYDKSSNRQFLGFNNLSRVFEKIVVQNLFKCLNEEYNQIVYASYVLEHIFYEDDTFNYVVHPFFLNLTSQHADNLAEIVNYRENVKNKIKKFDKLREEAEEFAYGYVIYDEKINKIEQNGMVFYCLGEADTQEFIVFLYEPPDVDGSYKHKNYVLSITFYHEVKHLLDSFIFREENYSYTLGEFTAELYAGSFIKIKKSKEDLMSHLKKTIWNKYGELKDELKPYFAYQNKDKELYDVLCRMTSKQLRVYSFAIPYVFAFTSLKDLDNLSKLNKEQIGDYLIRLGEAIASVKNY